MNNICNVCLCTERKLSLLNNHIDLFMRIFFNLKPSHQIRDLLLCWECQSLLNKVQKFQEKALRAQDFFEHNVSADILQINQGQAGLSTLTSVTKSDYDYVYSYLTGEYDQNDIKDTTHVKHESEETRESKLFDVNEAIKNENDYDYYNDLEKVDTDDEISDIKLEFGIGNESVCGDASMRKRKGTSLYIEYETDSKLDDALNLIPIKKKKNVISSLQKQKKRNVKTISVDELEIMESIEKGERSRKRGKQQNPYKVITTSNDVRIRSFKRIHIDEEELKMWQEKERNRIKNAELKCNGCITEFIKEKSYLVHMEKFHSESAGAHECSICGRRHKSKQKLKTHHKLHYFKHICTQCDGEYYKHDLHSCRPPRPAKIYECHTCGWQFDTLKLFFNHYKLHTTFICDYCGKTTTTKNALLSHMRHTHLPIQCSICKVTYKYYRFLVQHMKERHTVKATEDAYCVECNMQFENLYRYKKHLRTSVKHVTPKKVRYPCKECDKTFSKITAANNHYNYIHKKQTKFICEPCNRYFLNGFRLRQHKESVHMNIRPVKNKICGYCGRAFSANRILVNHIRTHTGERPFKCSQCPAAFSQKQALTAHMRAIHKQCNK